MKNFMPAIIVLICVVLGSFGGQMLKGDGSTPVAAHSEKDAKASHGDEGKDSHGKKPKAKKKSKGHGDESKSSSEVTYFKFSREFVVPIMRDSKVNALIIININLEVDSKAADEMFSLEPKLRDNIMTSLVGLSTDGRTLDNPTSTESYETIRSVVLMNLQSVVSTGIQNVLILDMAKQDVNT